MDTETFLAHVLPDVGLRVVVAIEAGNPKPKQTFHKTNALAASRIAKADTDGVDVYFACATYKNSSSRKVENVEAIQSWWLDIDVGPGKPYATQAEAIADLRAFIVRTGCSAPSIVSSGTGLHVYWPSDKPLTLSQWLPTAQVLKRAARVCGLQAGPERTADAASILRPPGSTHRKGTPIAVRIIREGPRVSQDTFHAALLSVAPDETHSQSFDLDEPGPHIARLGDASNADLQNPNTPYNPVTVEEVALACAVIADFRDTGGANMPEPLWRACIGVVRLCEDGEQIVHEWSQLDPRYTPAETQAKIDGLEGTGATLCSTFEQYVPDTCQACPAFGKCKSPMGAVMRSVQPAPLPVVMTQQSAAQIPALPVGFAWSTKNGITGIYCDVFDKSTGNYEPIFMSPTLFYAIAKVEHTDRSYSLVWRIHTSPTNYQDVTLPNNIASDVRKLFGTLGNYQVIWDRKMSIHLQKYCDGWINYHRMQSSVKSHNAFGWTDDDGFVIGDTKLLANGSEESVVLSGTAQERAGFLKQSGDLKTWADLVDRAYNNAQSDHWKFAVLCSFGAPLMHLLHTVQGVTVYMHSEKSGFGKSTAEQVALSVWGTSEGLALSNQRVTQNALAANLGAMRNLPAVLDELTAMDGKTACDLVHLVSSGLPKERCNQQGELLHRHHMWRTILLTSGNTLLGEKMSMHRKHAEAEVARLWEYTIPFIEPKKRLLQPGPAFDLFSQFGEHYGVAGKAFMRYVVDNRNDVVDLLNKTYKQLGQKYGITQTERFWGALLACTTTALLITRKLGILRFDVADHLAWIKHTLADNRGGMTSVLHSYQSALQDMLADLHGQLLVTEGKGSAYLGKEAHIYRHPTPGKPLAGRVIIQTPGPLGGQDAPAVYISETAAKLWCSAHQISFAELVRQGVADGLLQGGTRRFSLGQGCPSYQSITQPVDCLLVDPAHLSNVIPLQPIPLGVVAGGKSKP